MASLTALFYAGLRATGCIHLAQRLHHGGLVLCYHNVTAASRAPVSLVGDPAVHLPVDRFGEQMEWLVANYDTVALAEFVDRVVARRPLQRVASVTFDDAYAGTLNHALPVLRQLGVPATLFVVSAAAEHREPFWWDHPGLERVANPARRARWLGALRGDGDAILRDVGLEDRARLPPDYLPAGWEMLAAAARSGLTLGVHSATHRSLPRLSDAELEAELVASRVAIERHTGTAPACFAYPYGLWDARVREAVRAAGYTAACTLDPGLVEGGTNPWALPRVNVPAGIGTAAFQAWSAGLSLRALVPW